MAGPARPGTPACSIAAAVELGFGGESFTTGVLAELGPDTGRLECVDAGHPEPLLLRHDQHIKTFSCESGLSFGLGLQPDGGYPVGHDQLNPATGCSCPPTVWSRPGRHPGTISGWRASWT